MLGGWSQAALAARLCCLLDFRPFHLLHSAVFGIAENCVMRWRNAHLAWMHGIRCVPQGFAPAVRTWMRAGCAATDQPQPNSAFAALNQAPKARLAAFGIENRLASPNPDRLLEGQQITVMVDNPALQRRQGSLKLLLRFIPFENCHRALIHTFSIPRFQTEQLDRPQARKSDGIGIMRAGCPAEHREILQERAPCTGEAAADCRSRNSS